MARLQYFCGLLMACSICICLWDKYLILQLIVMNKPGGITKVSITRLAKTLKKFESKTSNLNTLNFVQGLAKQLEANDSEFKKSH